MEDGLYNLRNIVKYGVYNLRNIPEYGSYDLRNMLLFFRIWAILGTYDGSFEGSYYDSVEYELYKEYVMVLSKVIYYPFQDGCKPWDPQDQLL